MICAFFIGVWYNKNVENFKLTFGIEIKYKPINPQGWNKKLINPTNNNTGVKKEIR